MKWSLLLLTFVGLLPSVHAAAAAYKAPDLPRIPNKEYICTQLGLAPNTGKSITAEFQSAIDQVAKKGGGRLILSPGQYLLGPVTLPSRIDLHFSEGAVINLIGREDNFPTEDSRYANLFTATDQTDIRLSGKGQIIGHGELWWKAYRAGELKLRRPQMIALERCDRVDLDGFTLIDPPNGHVALRLCREVTIRNVTLRAPDDSTNTDGFNISGKNYLIEHCDISTGDDNIVILTHSAPRDWLQPTCENFMIRDNRFGFGHGLSLGSYTGGGISNVTAERITMDGTTSGIRMKASRDRGGPVDNITYRDITMRGVKNPVFISSYYPREPKTPGDDEAQPITATTPRWDRILIENLTALDCRNSITIWGVPEMPVGRVILRNCTFEAVYGAKIYNAPSVALDHVTLNASKGSAYDYWPAKPRP
jgi:polygalacturonase